MKRMLCLTLIVCLAVPAMVFGAGASQAEKPAETKELLIWSHWGNEPGKRAWIDEVVAEYQAANPNIRFKIEWYGDKNDLYTQLNAANQAGGRNAPDIHTIDFRPYGGIPQEQNGWLLDLAKGLNKDHWDPNLLSAASYGNAIWGIPLESFGIWVWYDKNLFAKWGLQVPADGKMSWELFQQIRAKAVENNMLVFSQGVQNLPIFASHFPTSFLINHAGVDLVREAVIKGTRPYNDPAMVRGLQAGVDLIPQLFNADVATLVLFQGAGLFFNGKAALTLEGSFLTSWLGLVQKDGAAPASLDLGIMRFPVIPGGSGTSVIQSGAGSGWAASAFTKHADVVIDFFNFISTPARGSRWIELSQVTTGIKANIPASASELIRNQAKWLQEGPAISPALYQVPGGDEAVYWTQGMTRFFVDRNYTAKEFLDEMQRLRERRK